MLASPPTKCNVKERVCALFTKQYVECVQDRVYVAMSNGKCQQNFKTFCRDRHVCLFR